MLQGLDVSGKTKNPILDEKNEKSDLSSEQSSLWLIIKASPGVVLILIQVIKFLSFCFSVFLPFCFSVFLSFCPSVFLSFCLSVFRTKLNNLT